MAIIVTDGLPHKPGRKGWKRLRITGEDAKNTSKIVEEVFPGTRAKSQENVQRQADEQKQGETMAFPNGAKLRMESGHAESAYNYMKRRLPKGPPATKSTFQIGAHFENGVLVRDDE